MPYVVKRVENTKELHRFIRFPHELYRGSAQWVPPLDATERVSLDPLRNPLGNLASFALFLVYEDNRIVGRLAAIVLQNGSSPEGRFGWFDVIDAVDATKALFTEATVWWKSYGITEVRGPMGFTNLDKLGLLIGGFDELPTISAIYNYPYYRDHLESLGFQPAADYVEYEFPVPEKTPEKVLKFSDLIAERYGLHIVPTIRKKEMLKYGRALFHLINETHRNLYGFAEMPDSVIDFYIDKYLKMLRMEFIVLVVDAEDRLVAYALTMPSYSRAFQRMHGRLFPFGIWHLWRASRHVQRVDLLLIGVADDMRNKGVTAMIFARLLDIYRRHDVRFVESNPELEDNQQVHALWKNYTFRRHKRRRIYRFSIV